MNKKRWLFAAVLLIVGVSSFFAGQKFSSPEVVPPPPSNIVEVDNTREIRSGGYKFINPLVECDCYKPTQQVRTVQMEESIKNYIAQSINEGKATHVSVYYRDLNNGPWIGIDEDETFTPASLLKVLVLIASLKKAEDNPLYLKKLLVIKPTVADEFSQNILDTSLVVPGKSYTIQELITRMVKYSDNNAATNIWEDLGVEFMNQVYEDVDVKVSGVRTPMDEVSVKEYSSFFRILYNASYLSKKMSERALALLTEATYDNGLVSGIPKNVTIAHKFGERGIGAKQNETLQLHDCGIVYAAQMPYLICVMTRGRDFKQLSSVIADISAIVYKNVAGGK